MKWLVCLLLILGTLSGCVSEKKGDSAKTENQSLSKTDHTSAKNENTEHKGEKNSDKAVETKNAGQKDQGLILYRPKVGSKKVFVGANNSESFKEEIAYENDNYVQSIVRIGQSTSVVVYKWTANEISIVSVVKSPSDPYKNYLNGLNESKDPETMISTKAPSMAIWKVINKDETVQTPYKSYNHVYVIQKKTNEVEGADTIYTYYLAPGAGIVKEIYKVTGDQGYSEESLLQKIEE